MKYSSITNVAHNFITPYLSNTAICVDMTLGNGYDTLFLAQNCKLVYSFDIQNQSLIHSKALMDSYNIPISKYKFILDDHQNILKYVSEKIDIAVFNLGYLPNGDKSIVTQVESTFNALKNLLYLMNDDSIIIITFYKHEEGLKEYEIIQKFTKKLDQKYFNVFKFEHLNKSQSPIVVGIEIKNYFKTNK